MAKTLQPGDMLPVRQLRPLTGGRPVRIGSNRSRAQVLVVTHAAPCDQCFRYLDALETVVASVRAEKGDVLALVGPDWHHDLSSLAVPAVVVDDAIAEMLSPARTPVVAIVDRFGQIFSRVDAGAAHSFPDHDEILSGLLDIGIRCPECGVPDVPSRDALPGGGTRSGGMILAQ